MTRDQVWEQRTLDPQQRSRVHYGDQAAQARMQHQAFRLGCDTEKRVLLEIEIADRDYARYLAEYGVTAIRLLKE